MVTPANQMAARHHYIQAALPQSKHGVASIRTQPETLIEVEEALHRISVRIVIEPWRASAFPIIKDLMVDRSAFDRIIESGGFITAPTGGAPDANLIPIPKTVADAAMDASQCIGCGACVAACPNGAANLFTGAKIAHLNLLPQGQAERFKRTEAMVETMDEYFGSCTNHGECEAACPKEISIDVIALMNKDYRKSKLKNRKEISRT